MAMRTHFAAVSAAFAHPSCLAFSTLPANPLSSHRRNVPSDAAAQSCRAKVKGGHSYSSSVRSGYTSLSSHERPLPSRWYSDAGFCSSIRNINLRRQRPSQSTTRLFGSKPGSPNSQPGQILLSDDRDPPSLMTNPIDIEALHRSIATIRDIIGYPTYDVSLSLVDEQYMKEINGSTRGVDASTDVLSFCFHERIKEPGVLGEAQFDIADYYNLGDMLIDVDYVRKRCEEDRMLHTEEAKEADEQKEINKADSVGMLEGEVVSELSESDTHQIVEDGEEEEDGYEYEYIEVETDEYDDRGVAPAMQYIYNPEIRIHMLLVHGMLHLVGYDHIEDDDYELMVVREDEVMAELKSRLGDNFGVVDVRSNLLE